MLFCLCSSSLAASNQFLLVNFAPGRTFNQNQPDTFTTEKLKSIVSTLGQSTNSRALVGASFIFSYFNSTSDQVLLDSLRRFLDSARDAHVPVLVQLDGEYWLGQRPDLWNWWDPARPGFDPANARHVEWTGWSPEHALKLGWLNWGRQIRVLPPPNLMSPGYRRACHEKMNLIVPEILSWWRKLPPDKQHLFVGLKVGWESSIGVNVFHYPDGNRLLDKSEKEDPKHGIDPLNIPSRGMAQIGYAAVSTAGIRKSGQITEADLAEVARRHMEDLSRCAAELGVPRDRLFTHGAGWKEGELNYAAALNRYSCPGWSFYRHAVDPAGDPDVQALLKKTDAPYWAATEWLLQSNDEKAWKAAVAKTLADPRCRYVCIFNWEGIRDNPNAIRGIRSFIE